MIAIAGCNTSSTPPAIVIGHVSDNTRADKAGVQAELGMRLALGELSKDGALAEVFGGKKIHVQHTDTEGVVDAFESQAVRLFNINRSVAILGGLSPKEVTALDHVKEPILTFHGQPVTGASNQVFYLGMSATRQGQILASVAALDRGIDKVVILQDERRSDAAAFVEAFQKKMIEGRQNWANQFPIITTIRFGKETKPGEPFGSENDWRDIVTRVAQLNPDAVAFAGSVQDFNAWRRICRKDKVLTAVRLIHAGTDGDHQFDRDPDAKTGILVATAFHADPASEKVQSFLKAFRAMPAKTEANVNAALAYDGMRILVEAMKQTPTQLTPEKLHESLLKTKDFDGLNGPLTINSDRQVQRPLFVMRWQGGALTLVQAFPM